MTYEIIAYPNGIRTVVATLHDIKTPEGAVIRATAQAKVRGEYVDVLREDPIAGFAKCIAIVGPEGPIATEVNPAGVVGMAV